MGDADLDPRGPSSTSSESGDVGYVLQDLGGQTH